MGGCGYHLNVLLATGREGTAQHEMGLLTISYSRLSSTQLNSPSSHHTIMQKTGKGVVRLPAPQKYKRSQQAVVVGLVGT